MPILNWKVTQKEHQQINRIAQRAKELAKKWNVEYSWHDAQMDLTCVHLNDWHMNLARLEAADDFNFSHDVFGIAKHLNRETGKLEDCFVPRFAAWRQEGKEN